MVHHVVQLTISASLVLGNQDFSLLQLVLKLVISFLNCLLFLLKFSELLDGVAHAVAHLDEVGDVAAG